ncbi:hypothetical protein EJM73_08225 [Clostridium botulinum]|uniref:hypothetical protein n=1 Tax=Clostridium botulinum TaxID=1491 RepID=UPI00137551C0|nr:hypothetical protein [Clostridium botulinum]NCI19886.1 hypothetical protein [Clostridium botulinum]NCI35648.1 hypothetical protein [Clostridium botulinum]NCI71781.1 hypothetical protein [Clostridium botulinum]NDI38697.1 hypothetical protein [Clostridium botulinum]
MEMIKNSLTSLGVVIVCGAISVASAYVSEYMKKLTEKAKAQTLKLENETQKELVDKAIDRTNQLVTTNVIKAQETLVKELKDKAKDGNVDKRDLKDISEIVKKEVLVQLSEEVKQLATTEIQDLEKYIEAQIEVSLATLKKQI